MMIVTAITVIMMIMTAITVIMVMIMAAITVIMVMIVAAITVIMVMIMAAMAVILTAVAILLFRLRHGPGDGIGHLLFHDGGDDILFPHHHENGLIILHFDVGHQQLAVPGVMLQHGIGIPGVGHQRSHMKTENPPVRGG